MFNSDGTETRRPAIGGERQRRPLATVPACYSCPKIPHGSTEWRPARAVELSDRNWQAWHHYQECVAVNWNVGDADDPIVRRNAVILREVVAEVERANSTDGLLGLLAKLKVS